MSISLSKISILVTALILLLLPIIPSYQIVEAQGNDTKKLLGPACNKAEGSELCKEAEGVKGSDPISGRGGILSSVINIVSWVVGVASVIVIMIAGLTMILSSGDSNSVKQARESIIYAAIGLVVAVSAQAILNFVVNRVR